MSTRRINKVLVLAVLVGAAGSGAIADSYTSVSNGYWGESSTWSPAGVPGTADVVTVDHTVTITTNVTVGTGGGTNAIVINSGGHLRHETSGYTLIANGNIQVYSNGTLTWGPGTTTKVDCTGRQEHAVIVNAGGMLNATGAGSTNRDCRFEKVNEYTHIYFAPGSGGTLRYCFFQAQYGNWQPDNMAAVIGTKGMPTIDNCEFVGTGSDYGLYVRGGNPTIINCVFDVPRAFYMYSTTQGTYTNLLWVQGGATIGVSSIEGENWDFASGAGIFLYQSGGFGRAVKLKNSNPHYVGVDARYFCEKTWAVSLNHSNVPGQTHIWGDLKVQEIEGAGGTSKWNYADESFSGAGDTDIQKKIFLNDTTNNYAGTNSDHYAHTKITAGSGETLEAKGAIGAPTIIDGGSFIFAEGGTVTLNRAVCKNSLEGGLKNDGGTIGATNVTLYNNTTGITHIAGTTTLKNSIIWGGTHSVSGSAAITYSDIQGGYTGLGNIDADPLFVDTSTNDFRLQAMSPCRNGGDPSDPAPPGGGSRIDIGAYEYPEPKGTQISIF